ncbi:MAG: ATP-binding protein [Actinomycetota bacterium]
MSIDHKERGRTPLFHLSPWHKIWALTLVLGLLAVALYSTVLSELEVPEEDVALSWWQMALLFFGAELLMVHFQFRRNAQTITMAELALVAGFFFSTPQDLVMGQALGAVVALTLVRRQTALKAAFNVAAYTLEAAIAAAIFFSLAGGVAPIEPQAWLATFAGTFSASISSVLLVGCAISLNEGDLPLKSIEMGLLYGATATTANTSVGLLGSIVVNDHPAAVVLIAVPVAVLVVAYRAYIGQTEKRETVEFLYESTRLAQENLESQAMVRSLLGQVREMFRAEVAEVMLFEDDKENMAIRTSIGPGPGPEAVEEVQLDPREGVWARVAAEGQAVLLPKPITNDRLRVHFAQSQVFKDAMVAPLHGAEDVIGTIMVGDRRGDVSTFDQEDLKLFETLANHASVTLENARLVDKLRQSLAHLTEMNELKDDFVAAVSHELRTPLTSIQGYVRTLLRPSMEDLDPARRHAFLEVISRQSDRLRNLIDNLLVVARLEAHKVDSMMGPVDLGELTREVVENLRDSLEGRPVAVEIPADLPPLESDDSKINQIVTNLVDNASKYSEPGTPIAISGRVEGKGVTVSVTDRGPGIPKGVQERIFERFYQVDQTSTRESGGTGLGLYICRRLAESVRGRLWLERSSEQGSTFSLWIPSAPAARRDSSVSELPHLG